MPGGAASVQRLRVAQRRLRRQGARTISRGSCAPEARSARQQLRALPPQVGSADAWQCLMGQYLMPTFTVPYFMYESSLDGFQIPYNCGGMPDVSNSAEMAYCTAWQQSMLAVLSALPTPQQARSTEARAELALRPPPPLAPFADPPPLTLRAGAQQRRLFALLLAALRDAGVRLLGRRRAERVARIRLVRLVLRRRVQGRADHRQLPHLPALRVLLARFAHAPPWWWCTSHRCGGRQPPSRPVCAVLPAAPQGGLLVAGVVGESAGQNRWSVRRSRTTSLKDDDEQPCHDAVMTLS